MFVREDFDFLIAAAVAWVLGTLGLSLGMAKGRQLADALGVTRHLDRSRQDVAAGGDIVDTSAVMDRSFLVMGRIGLFGPELLVPEPVADELATLAEGPDPVASRRARRGLEAVEELRNLGVKVTFVQGDVPGAASIEEKVDRTRGPPERPGRHVLGRADPTPGGGGRPVLDLRRLVNELSPDHVPGEHLKVDLIRAGRQPQQAIGFLPDGRHGRGQRCRGDGRQDGRGESSSCRPGRRTRACSSSPASRTSRLLYAVRAVPRGTCR